MNMKTSFLFLLLTVPPALAQESNQINGYRDCSPHNLSACQNSNQFFFGPSGNSPRAPRKSEFSDALKKFLLRAPKNYSSKFGFAPAQIAQESLTGPGDHHDRLPNGDWFFDGFTPHDAPDKGAVLFDGAGRIIAVALVNTDTDVPSPKANFGQYRLRIFSKDNPPKADHLKLIREWASSVIDPKSVYPGVFPDNRLVASELVVWHKDGWHVEVLP
jgi:hypothetical protein